MTLPMLCHRLRALSRLLAAGTTPTSRSSGAAGRDRPVWRLGTALLGAVLFLSLAAPACAVLTINLGANDTLTIVGTINDDIEVFGSGRVSIPAGTSISGTLRVHGSTLVTISGGSVGGSLQTYDSSTVNFSAGSLSRVLAFGTSTVSISGGSISLGLEAHDNSTVTVTGSCLLLAGGRLTGTLQNGGQINVPASGPIVLQSADTQPPTITCPPSVILPQDPGMRAATFFPTPPVAQDSCPGVTITGTRSDGFPLTDHTYPVGATLITWTATDASGNQATCTQEIDVHDSRIVGVVGLDSNGNHLPDPPQEPRLKGVTIELRDPGADELWVKHPETKKPDPLAETKTNEVGNFSFPVAPPGVYDVVVKLAPGQTISALFPGPSQKAQVVTVNGEQRLRVTMQVGDTVAGLGILLQ
jgi:HYR domain-containing protein